MSKITNLKKITIRFDEESITYFKAISEEVGIPYQSLINLYLRDCAATNRKLNLNWTTPSPDGKRWPDHAPSPSWPSPPPSPSA